MLNVKELIQEQYAQFPKAWNGLPDSRKPAGWSERSVVDLFSNVNNGGLFTVEIQGLRVSGLEDSFTILPPFSSQGFRARSKPCISFSLFASFEVLSEVKLRIRISSQPFMIIHWSH